jgi:hypothetical protein
MLWVLLAILPLLYLSGAYLTYEAVSGVVGGSVLTSRPRFAQTVLFTTFSSLGVSAFLSVSIVSLLSPDETVIVRVLAPLPISAVHRRIGTMLPGLLLLVVAQAGWWLPALAALATNGYASPALLTGVAVFGLLSYGTGSLLWFQLSLSIVTSLIGSERIGLRSISLPLGIVIGLIGLTTSLAIGAFSLLAGSVQPWLWLVPSFWMSLVLGQADLAPTALGMMALVLFPLIAGGCYIALLNTYAAGSGNKGAWVPLRWLPFSRSLIRSCMAYEAKAAARDPNLMLGFGLVITTLVAAIVAGVWLRVHHNNLWRPLLVTGAAYLGTLLLCSAAQMSWGRDQDQRRVLAVTPLSPTKVVVGKLLTNAVGIFLLFAVFVGALTYSGGEPAVFADQLRVVPLAVLVAFLLGVAIPYNNRDPLVMSIATAALVLFGAPLQILLSRGLVFIQAAWHLPSLALNSLTLVAYVGVAFGCLLGILKLDRRRLQRDRA